MRSSFLWIIPVIPLLACSGGNLDAASDYDAPKAQPLLHPSYDPYAAYGSANATWVPPVYNRNGLIVRPEDPNITIGRPDYEHAQWATGAAGGSVEAPPGTF